MNVLGWVPSATSWGEVSRRTERVDTEPCVELLLDGQPMSELLRHESGFSPASGMVPSIHMEGDVDALAVMTGQVLYELWDHDRLGVPVPVLVCQCGDLQCGALMVDLTINGSVDWRNWRWDNINSDSTPVNLPPMSFDRDHYERAVADAVAWTRENRAHCIASVSLNGPDSVVIGPMPWHSTSRRATKRRMARALKGTRFDLVTGDLEAFAETFASVRMQLLEGVGSKNRAGSVDESLLLSIRWLQGDTRSLGYLPQQTVEALAWLANDLEQSR